MAETFSTPFGDIDPAAVEAATAAAEQASGRKDSEEITIKGSVIYFSQIQLPPVER